VPVLDRFRLDDKVVVVTGASSGLGVAFAHNAGLGWAKPASRETPRSSCG
jgi:NAD(P)-dependent dehydrogenase (short-subunit alcohol dehydrogenase family)